MDTVQSFLPQHVYPGSTEDPPEGPSNTPVTQGSTHFALHTVVQSAKLRRASRPPLPEIVVVGLRQAVQSAEDRTARSPSSPTLETLRRIASSAKARGHSVRSPSLDTLLDVVRSAEVRGQTLQPSPSMVSLLQAVQSAEARKAFEPLSPVLPISQCSHPPSPAQPPTVALPLPPSENILTEPPSSSTQAKAHVKSASEDQSHSRCPPTPPTPESPDLEHGALAQFFHRYRDRGFRYDPDELPLHAFRRLTRLLGLSKDDPRSRPLYENFGKAMVAEFGVKFGRNMDDLVAWQRLCKRIGINPIPTTLAEARAEFRRTNVNIVELMMARIPDGEMEKFATEEKLAEYTRANDLTFPREFVEEGGILQYLLRSIWVGQPKRKR